MSKQLKASKRTNHKFTPDEDAMLKKLVGQYGESDWDEIASLMPGRNPRQCHDRWIYYISPNVNNSPWTEEEDARLIKLSKELNGKWVQIAKKFKGRNDTQIKNRWNILKKMMMLPDIQRKKKVAIQKIEEPVTIPEHEDASGIITDIFSQIDTIFSTIDNNICDFSNEFFF